MTMEHRNEWLAWVATAFGLLGLVGLASAQPIPNEDLGALPLSHMVHRDRPPTKVEPEATEWAVDVGPITDDGRSAEVPLTRQLIVVRTSNSEGPLQVELFNERGELLQRTQWSDEDANRKTVDLYGLSTGRYVARISGAGRSQVVRFRQD